MTSAEKMQRSAARRPDGQEGVPRSSRDNRSDPPPTWYKAEPPNLTRTVDVETAVNAIYWSCWKQWRSNEPAAIDGRDPEGVHQLRVGLRRARSATTLFKMVLIKETSSWISSEAKWSLSLLGPARDWDVFLTELLHPIRSAMPEDPHLQELEVLAAGARARAYDAVRAGLSSDRHQKFCEDFEHCLNTQSLTVSNGKGVEPLSRLAKGLLSKRHKRAMSLGKNFESLSPEERHRLRIALKKLRYAVEFFSSLYPAKKTSRYTNALKGMQDDLGHLNDISVASRLLAELPSHPKSRKALHISSGLVRGWYAGRMGHFETHVLKNWRRLRKTEPFWR